MAQVTFKPTKAQEDAIGAPIMDLLVSAAAGSGKTAVLSRRILCLVSEGENPVSINRMLVVTFTKAAAEELKMRIGKELKKALAELRRESGDGLTEKESHLAAAIAGVASAEISTIHSFCFTLIRKHFSELGLSASLKIGEETEIKLLKLRVMEETVDSLFENDPAFHEFSDNLIELKDTRLSETLLDFYEKFIALPAGLEALVTSVDTLRKTAEDFEKTAYREVMLKTVSSFFSYYDALYQKIITGFADYPEAAACLDAYRNDHDFIRRFEAIKDKDFFTVCREMSGFQPIKRASYRGEKYPFLQWAFSVRDDFKKSYAALCANYLCYTASEYTRDALATADFLAELYRVLIAFESAYTREKAAYGILDFTDLERYSYKLLVKDGKPTDIALSVQSKYDAVFIDEYQDTNDLQDAIFSAISRHNRFMVGDIKQSIYAFRGAVPELFSQYREKFPPYVRGADQTEATIFLSDNFRCDQGVIDYSNKIFEKLFRFNSGKVPYLDEDALSYGKLSELDAHLETELLLVNKEEEGEADAIARKIASLIRSGIAPKDIVILLRSMTGAEAFRAALDRESISCQCGRGEDVLFDHPEVMLLIALLNVIDNPTRDIYLAASLKSPLFGITLGELALLRNRYEDTSLYASLLRYREEKADAEKDAFDEKLDIFFAFLEKARRYAEMQSSDKVIRYLFSTTPIRAISVKYCQNCDALMAFYDYARAFESQGFRGVHALCRLIAEVDAKEDKDKPKLSSGVDLSSVRIMSIHASKGCEFDYVFLADTAKSFNAMDEGRALVYEKSLGVGLRIRESGGFIRYDTLIRRAISAKMRENRYDEEMRILYVALTRAKKQLIISGCVKKQEALDRFSEKRELPILDHPYLYSHLNNYRDMLATAYPEYPWISVSADAQTDRDYVKLSSYQKGEVLPETLKARLSYRYPYEAVADLPAKLSVSRLSPSILDEDAETLIRSEQADFDKVPLFMQDKVTASGAERGTATHLFMQFCDFENVLKNGVEKEIARLLEKSFITPAIASLIERERLETFFKSELFRRILAAREIYREERFNVRMPASDFTLLSEKKESFSEEALLVQGVVDCLIREADGSLVLIDYKTDRTPKDRTAAEKLLLERYTDQVTYYRIAIETLFRAKVKEVLLYSFSLGDTVTVYSE